MKVLVCGSRSWRDYERIAYYLSGFPRGTEFIHGDASAGADALAKRAAREQGYKQTPFPARWQREDGTFDKGAGFARNLEMLYEQPDLVVAFWDGSSHGTKHTITEARKRGIPVEVVSPIGDVDV